MKQLLTGSRSSIYLIAVLLFAGTAVRYLYLHQSADDPLYKFLFLDQHAYEQRAVKIAGGELNGGETPYFHSPLEAYSIALYYFLLGPDPLYARICQMCAGALTSLLVYFLSIRYGIPERTSILIAAFSFVNLEKIYFEGLFLSANPLSLLVGVLALIITFKPNLLLAFAAGTVTGLSTIGRPTMALLIIPCLFWIFISFRMDNSTYRKLLYTLVVFSSIVIFPSLSIIHNYNTGAGFVLTSGSGVVAWEAFTSDKNSLDNVNLFTVEDENSIEYISPLEAAKLELSNSNYREWINKTINSILENPLKLIKRFAISSLLSLRIKIQYHLTGLHFDSERIPILNAPLPLIGILVPLAMYGVFYEFRFNKASSLTIIFIICIIAGPFIMPYARFRIPLFVPLHVLAGKALFHIFKSNKRTAIVSLIISIYLLLLIPLRWDKTDDRTSIYMLGCSQLALGRTAEAESTLIHNAAPWNLHAPSMYVLGIIYQSLHDDAQAEFYLKRGVVADPEFALCWFELGKIYLKRDNIPDAEHCLRKGFEYDHSDIDAHLAMAELYRRQNKIEGTIRHAINVITLAPDKPYGYNLLKEHAHKIDPQSLKTIIIDSSGISPESDKLNSIIKEFQ